MNNELKTLQAIIDGADIKGVDVNDYDFTQPDAADESDSGGVWDLAGDIARQALREIYEIDAVPYHLLIDAKEKMQSLLYNLMVDYKDEKDDDE